MKISGSAITLQENIHSQHSNAEAKTASVTISHNHLFSSPHSMKNEYIQKRGSVLSSFIDRFRNAPVIGNNSLSSSKTGSKRLTSSDMWWIKNGNGTETKSSIQTSSPASMNLLAIHMQQKSDQNQILMSRNTADCVISDSNSTACSVTNTPSPIKQERIETNINVDDILAKWRNNRRLKRMTNNACPMINSNICYNIDSGSSELQRIKRRLGMDTFENSVQYQYQTDCISHDIGIQSCVANIPPLEIHPQSPKHQNPLFFSLNSSSNHILFENERKEIEIEIEMKPVSKLKRRYLSPRMPAVTNCMKTNVNFLQSQKKMKEQKAKAERLARIQRRMFLNEKNVMQFNSKHSLFSFLYTNIYYIYSNARSFIACSSTKEIFCAKCN